MLISKYTYVKWNARNKNHFVSLGYNFTKIGENFIVKIEDLTIGSNAKIILNCDYCKNNFEVTYYTYFNRKNKLTDCCGKPECTGKKAQDSLYIKYGVKNIREIDGVNEKIKNTCIEKYGVENPFQAEDIKNKIKQKNIEMYGVEFSNQRPEIAKKKSESLKNFFKNNPKPIGELSPCWKGGVEHSRCERATNDYNVWRKNVFERDRFECKKCFSKHTTLNAHHIFNWKDNIQLRYDINNGITLCKKCHQNFHLIYGKRNNTQQQLNDFLLDKKIC